jgi:hypothetical protein
MQNLVNIHVWGSVQCFKREAVSQLPDAAHTLGTVAEQAMGADDDLVLN